MNRIEELVSKIKEANESYRLSSTSIISDKRYDELVEELTELDPQNILLKQIGVRISNSGRKERLPISMASMNKVKSVKEIRAWMKSKSLPEDTIFCITPKFDGLSLLVDWLTNRAWTRGDGINGQNSDKHFEVIETGNDFAYGSVYTVGEVILPRKIFKDKYSNKFKNPRNTVSGVMNSDFCKEIIPLLKDCSYIRYGMIDCSGNGCSNKNEDLDRLNDNYNYRHKVQYKLYEINDLSEELLYDLFQEWNQEYEIDGLVIEVNDFLIRSLIKPETSTGNPGYSRAYKANFEQVKQTTVNNIKWGISKQGYLIPVAELDPVELDGVTVVNATINNAKQVATMGIGINSVVSIKRSGMVIPLIIDVIKKAEYKLPCICPSCGDKLEWNKTDTHLVCNGVNCEEQKIKQIISFFNILECEWIQESTCRLFYMSGYRTIGDILNMTVEDFKELERFGDLKANNIYNSIQEKIKNVNLSKLQHASGIFDGLGSKKLKLLEHFKIKPTVDEVKEINGFSDILAKEYVEKYDEFFTWVKELPVIIRRKETMKPGGGKFTGKSFVFTGFRSRELENKITEQGGVIKSGVSRNTDYLVMKEVGSGSGKERKALELGVVVLDKEQLIELI